MSSVMHNRSTLKSFINLIQLSFLIISICEASSQLYSKSITKRASCPCIFSVTSSSDHSSFQFFISSAHLNNNTLKVEEQILSNSTNFKSTQLYSQHRRRRYLHRIRVSSRGKYSIKVVSLISQDINANISVTTTFDQQSNHLQVRKSTSSRATNSCPNLNPAYGKQPQSADTERIIGGQRSDVDVSKYAAILGQSLLINFDLDNLYKARSFCSGVLISSRFVLTAAHCITDYLDVVIVGTTSLYAKGGMSIKIKNSTVHPDFPEAFKYRRDYVGYDIAYIELEQEIPSSYKFMKVNMNKMLPKPSSSVRIAGYGRLKDVNLTSDGQQVSNETLSAQLESALYQVDVPIVGPQKCQGLYKNFSEHINPKRVICSGYVQKGKCDACYGDSGGPVFQYDTNMEPVLVGIIEGGFGCGMPGFPGLNVKVSMYDSFIPTKGVTRVFEPMKTSPTPKPTTDTDDQTQGRNDNKILGMSTTIFIIVVIIAAVVVGVFLLLFVCCFRSRSKENSGSPVES